MPALSRAPATHTDTANTLTLNTLTDTAVMIMTEREFIQRVVINKSRTR